MDAATHPNAAARRAAAPRLAGTLAVAALPVAVALVSGASYTFSAATYLPLHAIVEVLVAFTGAATFAVQWYAAPARGRSEARARFLGAAALAMAGLELVHLLVFPGMPGLLGPATVERGIHYWLAARLVLVAATCAVLVVPVDSDHPMLRRGPLALAAAALVAGFVAIEVRLPATHGLLHVDGNGLTVVKQALEAVLAALSLAGGLLHLRRWRATGDAIHLGIAASLGWLVLGAAALALYERPYDVFNLLGHAYAVVSAWLLFHALFGAALLRPYHALDVATRDLAASNERLEALRRHVEGELATTITRLEESSAAAERARARLEATLAEREDLLHAVSHDLRGPLQIVLLQAERLQRLFPEEGARERRSATTIVAAARGMSNMIRDLVEAARLDASGLRLAIAPVDLAAFVPEQLAMAAGVLDVGRVAVELAPGLPPVLADASRLERVFTNLVGNALKYSRPPDPVRIVGVGDGAHVRVSVVDRGVGIAPEDLPRLFHRFQRGRLARNTEGLGLGLYIVRMLVEAQRGRVEVTSVPGEGSTFTVTLPAAR
jgi:signal transduction histidine kinase